MISHTKILGWLAALGLLVYLVLSFILAFERILCIDNSFFFFQIVNKETFFFPENRVGVILSQLPLLLAIKLNLSLNALVYIYSLSFIVEYVLIALVCRVLLKVKEAPLLLLLSLITGVANSFFHPVTETYHALAFATLFYSLIVSPSNLQHKRILSTFLLVLAASWSLLSHPIGIFLISFVALYSFFLKKLSLPKTALLIGVCILSVAIRFLLRNPDSYDNQQYSSLFEHLTDLLNIHNLYPFKFIVTRIKVTYLATATIFVALLFYLIRYKKFIETLLVFASVGAFCILGILTFAEGDGDIMVEKIFLPGIYMLIVPFVYAMYNEDNIFTRYLLPAITFLTIIYSFTSIIRVSQNFTTRLTRLEEVLAKQAHTKVIANYNDFPSPDQLKFNHWNTGFDALVIAQCKLKTPKTIFLTDDKISYTYNHQDSTLFLGPTWWPTWNNTEMNQRYLHLPFSNYIPFSAPQLNNE